MGMAGDKIRCSGGVIKIGIPFAIINLAVICAIYLLLAELGHVAFVSSSISEMPAGTDTSGLSRANGMLFWGVLLALAICPVISFAVSTFAGLVSAGANSVMDEKGAEINGRMIGVIMWAVVMVAALVYFGGLIIYSVNTIPPYVNLLFVILLFIFLAIPIVLILWSFTYFSTIGSRIFVKANAGSDISIASTISIVKKSVRKVGWARVKTSIGTLVTVWALLLFYAIITMILNLH